MSLLNKASLIQIPSGYKDGTLYSAKPTNGDGDFTFSRGSNLAATRVNSEGLIEKGRENLLLQSNSFDTTWTNASTSETGGQTGYDGSSDAWLLSKSSSSSYIAQSVSNSNVQTFSVYAKEGDSDWIGLVFIGGSNPRVYFDLSNGTSGTLSGGAIVKDIQSVGNGWYRCSVTCNGNINSVRLYPAEGDGVVSGTSGNILIQDAQLEAGLVSTDVITTTTTTVQAGILEDMPRLDYSGGATCPSLLLEPQRSNLVTQSEYFDSWTKLNAPTITTNIAISPDGNLNASGIQDTDGTNFKRVSQSVSITSNSTVTASIFVKKETNETNYGGLVLDFTGGTRNVFYIIMDSVNGVANNSTSSTSSCTISVTSFNDNWWKLVVTATDAGSNTSLAYQYFATIALNSTGGIGIGVGSVRTIYGAMLETSASYATSYIPTYGASVTRSFDDCTIADVSSLLGSATGTAYVDLVVDGADTLGNVFFTLGVGTSNLIYLWIQPSRTITYEAYVSGGLTGNISTSSGFYTYGDRIKVAIVWANNDFAMYINGTLIGTDTSGNAPTPTKLWLGRYTFGDYKGATIKQTLLFPTRLTNDELAELTTL